MYSTVAEGRRRLTGSTQLPRRFQLGSVRRDPLMASVAFLTRAAMVKGVETNKARGYMTFGDKGGESGRTTKSRHVYRSSLCKSDGVEYKCPSSRPRTKVRRNKRLALCKRAWRRLTLSLGIRHEALFINSSQPASHLVVLVVTSPLLTPRASHRLNVAAAAHARLPITNFPL